MKEFMIIYMNSSTKKTLQGVTNERDIFSAILEANSLCRRFCVNGIPLEVVSVAKILHDNGSGIVYHI